MTGDEMDEMARQCVEMMRTMGAMMGMHGDADLHAGGMSGMGGMGSMMDMAGGVGALFLALLLLLVGAAVLAIYLVRRPVSDRAREASPPLVELDRRYARGEVDRETFLQIRRDLQGARR